MKRRINVRIPERPSRQGSFTFLQAHRCVLDERSDLETVLREDPRYFREGSGPFTKRFVHAIIRPVVTRTDSGTHRFNWSGFLGLIAASSLSNVYYPATDRGVDRTFMRVATGIPFSAIDHLIDEFGPDLERKFLGREF